MATVTGIVLAAGAGTRMGTPKALMRTADAEPWVARSCRLLHDAGCTPVIVVLGADAAAASQLVPPGVETIVAENWAAGMSASLHVGLAAAHGDAALITLVDLPGMPDSVVRRVLEKAPVNAGTLRQATFNGDPGHPVLIGRDHFAAVSASLTGDAGARRYLVKHNVIEIECADLFDGADIDTPHIDTAPINTAPSDRPATDAPQLPSSSPSSE